jgi:PleD family two-component response regulator
VQCLGVDAHDLLRQVDANLYRAKAAGRDRTESSVLEAPMPEEVAV